MPTPKRYLRQKVSRRSPRGRSSASSSSFCWNLARTCVVLLLLAAWVLYSQSTLKSFNAHDEINISIQHGAQQKQNTDNVAAAAAADSSSAGGSSTTATKDASLSAATTTMLSVNLPPDNRPPTDYPGYMQATQSWANATTCAYPGKPFYR
jgi:hypothetical protein